MSTLKKFQKVEGNTKIVITIGVKGYWSITYDEYEGDELISCGSDNDYILKHFPQLKMFTDLHLSDVLSGIPMHYKANGTYFLDNLGDKYNVNTIMTHFRLTKSEANFLISEYTNNEEFRYVAFLNGLLPRFQQETVDALQELNNLCRLELK